MQTRVALLCALLSAAACSNGGGNDNPDLSDPNASGDMAEAPIPPDSPMLSVAGKVLDFVTDQPLASAAVTASGITPAPRVSVTGSDYTVDMVPANSVLVLLASSAPDYRATYNPKITVVDTNITGLDLRAVKETTLSAWATAFGVTPTAGTGVVAARVVDANGMPKMGVPAASIALTGAKGPYFLDATKMPVANGTATSASGWVVFFDVPAGPAAVKSPTNATYTMDSGALIVAANVATLTDVVATMGTTPVTTKVDFATMVYPIFMKRGCVNCHSGGGIGKELGGLKLDGSPSSAYRELTQEISPNTGTLRVDLANPPNSLVLTRPLYENPPDVHPTATFATTSDPDYMMILQWIKEGAKLTP